MYTEGLFIRTLDELEECIASNDDYTVLRASALIRKLFLDDYPLVDHVNRPHRLKIEFEVVDTDQLLDMFKVPGMPAFEFLGIQDALDPESIPNPPRKRVKRDVFFQTKVQVSKGNTFTIREIIKHQANIRGGVHAGKPKNDSEKILSEIDDTIKIFALPPGLRQLKAIGRIVLRALQPLKAVLVCSKTIEASPNDIASYYNRGIAYAMSGKLRKAVLDFDKAIELGANHPDVADVYYNRGHTYWKLAILDLEKYLELVPDSPGREAVLEAIELAKAKF